jgi:hypothetical protein
VKDEQEMARQIIELEYPNDPQWHAELKQKIKQFLGLLEGAKH